MTTTRILATALVALLLAACRSSDDGSAATSATMTVTPALGKVQGAVVHLTSLQGDLLAQGYLGSEGSVALPAPAGGFVVELRGGNGIFYFDESVGAYRPLLPGVVLHAVSAQARRSVAVTALTEIMYQRALALAGNGPLSAAHVTLAETELRTHFIFPADISPLDIPETVDSPLDLPASDTGAGQHASRLAAWAMAALQHAEQTRSDCFSATDCAPLPGLIDLVARDFADGSLDSQAAGTPLATPYINGAGYEADFLEGLLSGGELNYRDRVQRVRAALASTDAQIGAHLAGTYNISCTRALPTAGTSAVPVSVTIEADGSVSARSSIGGFRLGAGSSAASLTQSTSGQLGIARIGLFVPASAMGNSPVADGLSISLTPPPFTPNVELPPAEEVQSTQLAAIALTSSGHSRVWLQGEQWSCSTITSPGTTALVNTSARLYDWLPGGDYRCEADGNPDTPRIVSVGNDALKIRAPDYVPYSGVSTSVQTIPFAGYDLAQEAQDNPLGFRVLESWGHTHSGDDVAATVYPHHSLLLAKVPATPGPLVETLRIYRSLVTDARYFELTTDSLALRHCRRLEPPPSGGSGAGLVLVSFNGTRASTISSTGSTWVMNSNIDQLILGH